MTRQFEDGFLQKRCCFIYPSLTDISTNDNPGGALSADLYQAHVRADEYEMWALWECDDESVGTIPIPLRKFPWELFVRAELADEEETASWVRVGSYRPTGAGAIQHAAIGPYEFPEWSKRLQMDGVENSGIDHYDVLEPPPSP